MEKTRLRDRSGERGIAMITAMAAALIISIIAIAVLNMTLRRFELSAFRTDRAVAGAEAEAGVRYAFARLQVDQTFRNAVLAKAAGVNYILRCHDSTTVTEDLPLVPELHLGTKISPVSGTYLYNPDSNPSGKHVEVRISHDTAVPPRFTVRARAEYGTGN